MNHYKKWTKAEIDFVKANYLTMTNSEMAKALNCSRPRVAWRMVRMKLTRPFIKRWSAEEIAWIRANAHLGEPGLAKALNIDQSKIRSVLRNHGIRTGNKTNFKKGFEPWNAGMIGLNLNNGKGCFKKGMLPKNTLYDGKITVRHDKSGNPYKMIRIGLCKWEYLSRYTWQQANGPIPAKHLIRHIDGNPLNCELSNLMCMSKADNIRMNRNDVKRTATLAEGWVNGTRYENDGWIAKKLAPGNKELQAEMLAYPELIEAKRQQLILKRKLNNKPYEQPYQIKKIAA